MYPPDAAYARQMRHKGGQSCCQGSMNADNRIVMTLLQLADNDLSQLGREGTAGIQVGGESSLWLHLAIEAAIAFA